MLPQKLLLRKHQQLMAEVLAEVDTKAMKGPSVTVTLAAQTTEESPLTIPTRIAIPELAALMRDEVVVAVVNVKWTDIAVLLGVNPRSRLTMAGARMKEELNSMMNRLEKPSPRLTRRRL